MRIWQVFFQQKFEKFGRWLSDLEGFIKIGFGFMYSATWTVSISSVANSVFCDERGRFTRWVVEALLGQMLGFKQRAL